jgi:hypothetical protein
MVVLMGVFTPKTLIVPVFPIMFKPFKAENSLELLHHSGLEYWFKERRILINFRRGPLGSHFDGFAAYLKAKGFSHHRGVQILGKCCQFNAFLIDQGITKCEDFPNRSSIPFLMCISKMSEHRYVLFAQEQYTGDPQTTLLIPDQDPSIRAAEAKADKKALSLDSRFVPTVSSR